MLLLHLGLMFPFRYLFVETIFKENDVFGDLSKIALILG